MNGGRDKRRGSYDFLSSGRASSPISSPYRSCSERRSSIDFEDTTPWNSQEANEWLSELNEKWPSRVIGEGSDFPAATPAGDGITLFISAGRSTSQFLGGQRTGQLYNSILSAIIYNNPDVEIIPYLPEIVGGLAVLIVASQSFHILVRDQLRKPNSRQEYFNCGVGGFASMIQATLAYGSFQTIFNLIPMVAKTLLGGWWGPVILGLLTALNFFTNCKFYIFSLKDFTDGMKAFWASYFSYEGYNVTRCEKWGRRVLGVLLGALTIYFIGSLVYGTWDIAGNTIAGLIQQLVNLLSQNNSDIYSEGLDAASEGLAETIGLPAEIFGRVLATVGTAPIFTLFANSLLRLFAVGPYESFVSKLKKKAMPENNIWKETPSKLDYVIIVVIDVILTLIASPSTAALTFYQIPQNFGGSATDPTNLALSLPGFVGAAPMNSVTLISVAYDLWFAVKMIGKKGPGVLYDGVRYVVKEGSGGLYYCAQNAAGAVARSSENARRVMGCQQQDSSLPLDSSSGRELSRCRPGSVIDAICNLGNSLSGLFNCRSRGLDDY